MLVTNGIIQENTETFISHQNLALTHAHSIIEELRVQQGAILFWEAHYLKIMASMRMLRISIPMNFTPDFLSDLILKTLSENPSLEGNAMVTFQVYPSHNLSSKTEYHIWLQTLNKKTLTEIKSHYFEIGLYKDFFISKDTLSTLPTNNRLISSLAAIFAHENDLDACFILNTDKEVIGTNLVCLFVVSQSEIHTSGLTSGTTDTVYRKNLIALIEKEASYKIIEGPISPFSLQKASSLFILNVKDGIIPISKYRKKEYDASDLPLKLGLLLEAKTKEASV